MFSVSVIGNDELDRSYIVDNDSRLSNTANPLAKICIDINCHFRHVRRRSERNATRLRCVNRKALSGAFLFKKRKREKKKKHWRSLRV